MCLTAKKNQNIKQKQCCNKLIKSLKVVHVQKKKKKLDHLFQVKKTYKNLNTRRILFKVMGLGFPYAPFLLSLSLSLSLSHTHPHMFYSYRNFKYLIRICLLNWITKTTNEVAFPLSIMYYLAT